MGASYEVFLHPDGTAVCPECGGMAKADHTALLCHDCGSVLIEPRPGASERSVIYKKPNKEEKTK